MPRAARKTYTPISPDAVMSPSELSQVTTDAQSRMRSLFSDSTTLERSLALDHSSALSNIFSGYLSGADERNPGMRDSVVVRCAKLINLVEARVPLMSESSGGASETKGTRPPAIGSLTKGIARMGRNRIMGPMHPNVEQAINLLVATYAAHGYLSGVPGATLQDVGSGKVPAVDPYHLDVAIAENNGAIALAMIAAGADPIKTPREDTPVTNVQGSFVTIKAGDYEGLVRACTKTNWMIDELLKAGTEARARSMHAVVARTSQAAPGAAEERAGEDGTEQALVQAAMTEAAPPSRRRMGM